jgi:hypothetical protein
MNKNVLLLFILIPIIGFCQPQKDLLLERDHEKIIERLQFIDYLNDASMKLKARVERGDTLVKTPFYKYYNDIIIKENPFTSVNISQYLGYSLNAVPKDANEFLARLYHQNAQTLFDMINRYGFPSNLRLKQYVERSPFRIPSIIDMAPLSWKKRLYPLVQKEYTLGNVSEVEQEFCDLYFRGGILTEEESLKFRAKMKALGISPPEKY